jgi:hypothetical protein
MTGFIFLISEIKATPSRRRWFYDSTTVPFNLVRAAQQKTTVEGVAF